MHQVLKLVKVGFIVLFYRLPHHIIGITQPLLVARHAIHLPCRRSPRDVVRNDGPQLALALVRNAAVGHHEFQTVFRSFGVEIGQRQNHRIGNVVHARCTLHEVSVHLIIINSAHGHVIQGIDQPGTRIHLRVGLGQMLYAPAFLTRHTRQRIAQHKGRLINPALASGLQFQVVAFAQGLEVGGVRGVVDSHPHAVKRVAIDRVTSRCNKVAQPLQRVLLGAHVNQQRHLAGQRSGSHRTRLARLVGNAGHHAHRVGHHLQIMGLPRRQFVVVGIISEFKRNLGWHLAMHR